MQLTKYTEDQNDISTQPSLYNEADLDIPLNKEDALQMAFQSLKSKQYQATSFYMQMAQQFTE